MPSCPARPVKSMVKKLNSVYSLIVRGLLTVSLAGADPIPEIENVCPGRESSSGSSTVVSPEIIKDMFCFPDLAASRAFCTDANAWSADSPVFPSFPDVPSIKYTLSLFFGAANHRFPDDVSSVRISHAFTSFENDRRPSESFLSETTCPLNHGVIVPEPFTVPLT